MINKFKKIIPAAFKRKLKRWYDNFWQSIAYQINRNTNKLAIKKIVFVCYGNICRSSYAEWYCKKKFDNEKIIFESCGLNVKKISKSPLNAIRAANFFNVDLKKHFSKQISDKMLENSDLIISMDYKNYSTLKRLYPKHERKIRLLREFDVFPSRLLCNIHDPFGLTYDEYLKCYKLINSCIDGFINKYKNINCVKS